MWISDVNSLKFDFFWVWNAEYFFRSAETILLEHDHSIHIF